MRARWGWLLSAVLVLSACEAFTLEGAGTFSISFSWDTPPEESVYIWARVEHRPGGVETGTIFSLAGPVEYVPGVGAELALGNVPSGDDRVVVVEVREGPSASLRIAWYGISEPFSIVAGQDTAVDVPLTFEEPGATLEVGGDDPDDPAEPDGGAPKQKAIRLEFDGVERDEATPAMARAATVVIEAKGAFGASLANNPGFSLNLHEVPFDGESAGAACDPLPSEAAGEAITCRIDGWDLTAGHEDASETVPDGTYKVYVKLVDALGYESEVYDAQVYLDGSGPQVSLSALSDDLAKPGQTVAVTLTLDEVIDETASTLTAVPAAGGGLLPVLEGPTRLGGGTSYLWLATAPEGSDGSSWQFTAQLVDELANPSGDIALLENMADPTSPPIALGVDGLAPVLAADPPVTLSGESFGLDDEGATVSFEMVLVDANPPSLPAAGEPCGETCPLVRLDGRELGTVSRVAATTDEKEGRWGFAYSYTLDLDDWPGASQGVPISIRWTDGGDNTAAFELPIEPSFDFVPPDASCDLTPEGRPAGIGEKVQVLVTATEALAPGALVLHGDVPFAETKGGTLTSLLEAGPFEEGVQAVFPLSIDLVDVVGNVHTAACTKELSVDTVPPSISTTSGPVSVSKTVLTDGEEVVLGFEVSEALAETPTVRVGTVSAAVASTGPLAYEAKLLVTESQGAGVKPVTIGLVDLAQNKVFDTASAPILFYDFEPPGHTCLFSHDAKPAKLGDVVQVSVSVDEALAPGSPKLVTTGSAVAFDDPPPGFTTTYKWALETPGLTGSYTFSIELEDVAGNALPGACSGGGDYDTEVPSLLAATLTGDADGSYRPGDAIALALTVSETLAGPPVVVLGDLEMAVEADPISPDVWLASLVVPAGAKSGAKTFSITIADPAGNVATGDGGLDPVLFDLDPPSITCSISPPGTTAGHGDTIVVVANANEELASAELVLSSGDLEFTSSKSGFSFTFSATLADEGVVHTVVWGVDVEDLAGNTVQGECAKTLEIDTVYPEVTAAALLGGGDGVYREGEAIELSFQVSETPASMPEVSVGEYPAVVADDPALEGGFVATAVVPEGSTSGSKPIAIALVDAAGNARTGNGGLSPVVVDGDAPGVTCSPPAGTTGEVLGHGDVVSLVVNVTEPLADGFPELSLTAGAELVAFTATKSGFSTSFAAPLDEEGLGGTVSWQVDLEDVAGNRIEDACPGSVVVDTIYPGVTGAALLGDADGSYRPGDTLSISFATTEPLPSPPEVEVGDLAMTVTPDAAAEDGWLATVVVPPGAKSGLRPFTIVAVDVAGNVTETNGGLAGVLFDTDPPGVTCSIPAEGTAIGHGDPLSIVVNVTETLAAGYPALVVTEGDGLLDFGTSKAGFSTSFSALAGEEGFSGTIAWHVDVEDLAGNRVEDDCAGAVTLDTIYPEVAGASFVGGNDGNYRPGDALSIAFSVSEPLAGPPLVVAGDLAMVVSPDPGDPLAFVATLAVPPGAKSGLKPFLFTVSDAAGNATSTDADLAAIVVDADPPGVSCSIPDPGALVGHQDLVSIVVNVTEPLAATFPRLVFTEGAGLLAFAETKTGFSTSFSSVVSPEGLSGSIAWNVDVEDTAGNRVEDACAGTVTVDAIYPEVLDAVLTGDADGSYRPGDSISLTFRSSEPLASPPIVLAGELSMDVAPDPAVEDGFVATLVVPEGAKSGFKTVAITVTDPAGNVRTSDGGLSSLLFDTDPPGITCSISPAAGSVAGHLDTLSIVVNATESLAADSPVLVVTEGDGLLDFTTTKAGFSTSFVAVLEDEGVASDLAWYVDVEDLAGNTVPATCAGSIAIDTVYPQLLATALTGDADGRYRAGDTISLSFEVSETLAAPPSVAIGTHTAGVASDPAVPNGWIATLVVPGDAPNGLKGVSVTLTDLAGNVEVANDPVPPVDIDTVAPDPTCTASPAGGSPEIPMPGGKVGHGGEVSIVVNVKETLAAGYPELEPSDDTLIFSKSTSGFSTSFDRTFSAEGEAFELSWTVTTEDLAGNRVEGACAWSVVVDTTYPTLLEAGLTGDADGNYRPGDTVSLAFVASEPLSILPEVRIGELDAAVAPDPAVEDGYTASLLVPESAKSGLKTIVIVLEDDAGNEREIDDAFEPITFDTVAPEITCTVSPVAGTPAGHGQTLTIVVNATEEMAPDYPKLTVPAAWIFDRSSSGFSTTFQSVVGDEGLETSFDFTVDVEDTAGNHVDAACTGTIEVDTVFPEITGGAISATVAKKGATLTLTFSTSEELASDPSVTVGGKAATFTSKEVGSGNNVNWNFGYVVADADTPGTKQVRVTAKDLAGNLTADEEAIPAVTFDFEVSPATCTVSDSDGLLGLDQTLQVTFIPSEDMAPGFPAIDEAGLEFAETKSGQSTIWTFTAGEEGVLGPWSFTVAEKDLAGNEVAVACEGDGTIDTVLPFLVSPEPPKSTDDLEVYADGELLTIALEVSEVLASNPVVTVGGFAATFVEEKDLVYTYSFDVASGHGTGVKDIDVEMTDTAGNEVTETQDQVRFDFALPTMVTATVSPALAGKGADVDVHLTFSEAVAAVPSLHARHVATDAVFPFTSTSGAAGGTSFGYTLAVSATTPDGAYVFDPVSVADLAGNDADLAGPAGFTIDATEPAIADLLIAPEKTDETGVVTVDVFLSEPVDPADFSATLGGLPIPGCASADGSAWSCTWVVSAGDAPAGSDTTKTVLVTAADEAGNQVSDSGVVVFDFRDPVITCEATHGEAAPAGLGDEIRITVTSDEPLGATPVATSDGLDLALVSNGTTSATFSDTIDDVGLEEPFTWSIAAEDVAGNSLAVACSGSGDLDTVFPTVSGQAVSDELVKEGDEVLIDFTVSEASKVDPEVTIGGRAATRDDSVSEPLVHTYRYTVTSNDSDGVQTVQVEVTDLAGNVTNTGGFDKVTFDLTDPDVVATSVTPADAKTGTVVKFTLSVDEKLAEVPEISMVHQATTETRVLAAAAGTSTEDLSFVYSYAVDAADPNGTWTFEDVLLVDRAGNSVTLPILDGLQIDTEVPAIDLLVISPERATLGTLVTVTFEVSEPPPDPADLEVTIGGTGIPCVSDDDLSWTCTETASTAFVEDGKEETLAVLVSLEDAAGNRGTRSDSVVFDFRAPLPLGSTVTYIAGALNPLSQVTKATEGTTVTVTVFADELLDTDAGAQLFATGPGGVFEILVQPGGLTGTAAIFEHTFGSNPPGDGDYSLEVVWTDVAGNEGTRDLTDLVTLLATAPTVVIDQSQVVYVRSPWGNAEPETRTTGTDSYTIPAGSFLELAPADTLSGVTKLPLSTFTFADGRLVKRVRVWAESEKDTLLGTLLSVPSGGWQRKELATVNTANVFVSGIDEAGNESAAGVIKNVEWVASPRAGNLLAANPVTGTSLARDAVDPDADHELTATRTKISGSDTNPQKLSGSGIWRDVPQGDSPPGRQAPAVAFDAARGILVAFGGQEGGVYQDEVWEFDGDVWTLVDDGGGDGPSGRRAASMFYDAVRGRVVLFGGDNAGKSIETGMSNDTWEWDGTSWTEVLPSTPPDSREGTSVVWDGQRGRAILFGGRVEDALTQVVEQDGERYEVFYGETWAWNGKEWTQLLAAVSGPGARAFSAMAWDAKRDRIVAYGGTTDVDDDGSFPSLGCLRDTWEFDGTAWTLITDQSAPGFRAGHAMAYDPVREKVVLYGGACGGSVSYDTWEWDGAAQTWTEAGSINETHPTGGKYASLVWSPIERAVLHFGADGDSGSSNDVKSWNGSVWSELTPGPDELPEGREDFEMVFDDVRNRLVLWGGDVLGTFNADEVHEFDGKKWLSTTPGCSSTTCPASRKGHVMAFDDARKLAMLFGGQSIDGATQFGDLWEWNGIWTKRVVSGSPPARRNAAMVWDNTSKKRLLIHGGNSGSTGSSFDELWAFKIPPSASWTKLAPTTRPDARGEHAMAYDPIRKKVFLYGGRTCTFGTCGPTLGDLWSFNVVTDTWTNLTFVVNGGPGPRMGHKMTFDEVLGEVVLVGGMDDDGEVLEDAWSFDGTAGWTAVPDPGGNFEGRAFHGQAYAFGGIMVFGGTGENGTLDDHKQHLVEAERQAAITFTADASTSDFDPSLVTKIRVRALCGGDYGGGNGANLRGWKTSGAGQTTGGWSEMGQSTAKATPYTGGSAALIDWTSSNAAEAASFLLERDAQWVFQCLPSGGPTNPVTDTVLALDYLEVRALLTYP